MIQNPEASVFAIHHLGVPLTGFGNVARVWLGLNRVEGAFWQNGSSMIVPSSLWPLILERAGKVYYYSVRDEWERPTVTDTRVDAIDGSCERSSFCFRFLVSAETLFGNLDNNDIESKPVFMESNQNAKRED